MATVVWHGFHFSCSDQQMSSDLPPPPPVTSLRLKLAPQKPADNNLYSLSSVNNDVTPGQKPSFDATCPERKKDGFAPLIPSLPKLSDKSLSMCTENLGSENGSDVISDDADIYLSSSFMSSSSSDGISPTISKNKRQQSLGVRKVNSTGRSSSNSFPPPLTTMRGGERVLLRSHREEGRLVMDAVKCPPSRSNFVTDRSHGRLRLSLLRTVDDSDVPELGNQLIDTDTTTTTTTTLVNDENQFRQANYEESGESSRLDIINNRENENNIRDEGERENVTGRFQRQLPASSRCMDGEHEQLYHHRHQSRELVNLRLWVATS